MRKAGERGIFISWVVVLLTISSFSLPDPGEDGKVKIYDSSVKHIQLAVELESVLSSMYLAALEQ